MIDLRISGLTNQLTKLVLSLRSNGEHHVPNVPQFPVQIERLSGWWGWIPVCLSVNISTLSYNQGPWVANSRDAAQVINHLWIYSVVKPTIKALLFFVGILDGMWLLLFFVILVATWLPLFYMDRKAIPPNRSLQTTGYSNMVGQS
jgi:hypothetical protein